LRALANNGPFGRHTRGCQAFESFSPSFLDSLRALSPLQTVPYSREWLFNRYPRPIYHRRSGCLGAFPFLVIFGPPYASFRPSCALTGHPWAGACRRACAERQSERWSTMAASSVHGACGHRILAVARGTPQGLLCPQAPPRPHYGGLLRVNFFGPAAPDYPG